MIISLVMPVTPDGSGLDASGAARLPHPSGQANPEHHEDAAQDRKHQWHRSDPNVVRRVRFAAPALLV
jgi:hypothetical protein